MKKKNNISESDLFIPAKSCFLVDEELGDKPLEWQSWGLVIKKIRDFNGMDQDIFGRLLQGYTRMQISRYETESSEPPIDFWIKLMKYFGINICWALTGKGSPYIKEYSDSEERQRLLKWMTLLDQKDDFIKDLKGWK